MPTCSEYEFVGNIFQGNPWVIISTFSFLSFRRLFLHFYFLFIWFRLWRFIPYFRELGLKFRFFIFLRYILTRWLELTKIACFILIHLVKNSLILKNAPVSTSWPLIWLSRRSTPWSSLGTIIPHVNSLIWEKRRRELLLLVESFERFSVEFFLRIWVWIYWILPSNPIHVLWLHF